MIPTLEVDRPLATDSAVVSVPAGLSPGRYRVTLTVAATSGTSVPAILTLIVGTPRDGAGGRF